MSLCPTPTWRPPPRLYIRIAPALLCLACGKAPPAVDAEAPPTLAPSTAPPSAPPSAPPTAPPAPPASKPHATLFTGTEPTVPAAFEGLMPGMPLLAARVLFPQLPDDQIVKAPYAGLRFTIYIIGEQVHRLGIQTLDAAPAGARLRALMVKQWSAGAPTKDDSGRVLRVWHAPKTGVRAIHRTEPDGRAHVFFDAYMPLSVLTEETLPLLRAQIGRTAAQVIDAIDGATRVDEGVEVRMPALAFGTPTVVRLPIEPAKAGDEGTVERVMVDLSFAHQPAHKTEVLAALKAKWGRSRRDKSKFEAFEFAGAHVEAKATHWRVTLR